MKFINKTNKVMPFKKNGEWIDIQPGYIIELGENAKSVKGLEEIVEIVTNDKLNFSKMTKDQLNDYAAKIGLEEINSSMTKATMIKLIEEFTNEEK